VESQPAQPRDPAPRQDPAPLQHPAPLKDQALLSRDLAMLGSAARYDLRSRAEARRSCQDLVELFFRLAGIVEIDLFIEAGAKDAGSSRRARELPHAGRVVAFEANPFTHKRFAGVNAASPGVEYEHLALSDEPGVVTLNVRRTEDGRPRADGQASLLRRDSERDRGFVTVKVPATTLDHHFRDDDFGRAGLWMDVEGAAGPVLHGGQSTLDRTAVAIVEVEDRPMWGDQAWLRPQVLSFLYDRGLVPVARDFQSRYQYNIVLVRADLIDSVEPVRWTLTLFGSAAYGVATPSLRTLVSPVVAGAAGRMRARGARAARALRRRVARPTGAR
jgi:FkbM family methyltransferase